MVLGVDLNEPVAGSQQSEETAAPTELQHGYPAAENAIGSSASPIDVDAVDDEVILLPSSALFLEARNCARRRPDTVVINENMQTVAARSGVALDGSSSSIPVGVTVEEPSTSLHSIVGIETQRIIIDDESNAREACFLKMKDAAESIPEMQEEASPQPSSSVAAALTCPVCMSTLKEPSSTICGHVFCHECITMAVNKLKKCPTCRRKLNKKSIHRIFLPPL